MHRGSRNLVAGLLVLAAIGVLADGVAMPSATPAPVSIQGALPAECLAERNQGACVTCCKEKGFNGHICSAFCKTTPPPQPEPQP